MIAKNVKFDSITLWVQIWGAPFDMVCPQVATEVGGRLGMVVEVERRRRQDMQNLFMRVKMALPIQSPSNVGFFSRVQMDRKIGLPSSTRDFLCSIIIMDY